MYWLTRYTGSGTDDDPFAPLGVEQLDEWASIDKRGDATDAGGHVFLWADGVLPAHPDRLELAADVDARLPGPVRAQIRQRLGVNVLASTTLRGVLRELFTDHSTPPGDRSRWNPLRPAVFGKPHHHIDLGPHHDEFV